MNNRFILLLVLVVGLDSCAKLGCTDKNSDSYNSEATKNDNSCLYRYMYYTSIIMPYAIYGVEDTKMYIKLVKKNDSAIQYESDLVKTLYKSSITTWQKLMFSNFCHVVRLIV